MPCRFSLPDVERLCRRLLRSGGRCCIIHIRDMQWRLPVRCRLLLPACEPIAKGNRLLPGIILCWREFAIAVHRRRILLSVGLCIPNCAQRTVCRWLLRYECGSGSLHKQFVRWGVQWWCAGVLLRGWVGKRIRRSVPRGVRMPHDGRAGVMHKGRLLVPRRQHELLRNNVRCWVLRSGRVLHDVRVCG